MASSEFCNVIRNALKTGKPKVGLREVKKSKYMFNSLALDVVIGLIFIFLLYSLLASILQEFVAKIFGLRARMLLKAISNMLDNDKDIDKAHGICKLHTLKWSYFRPFYRRSFSKVFYDHPNIKCLGKNEFSRKPAYISDVLFAETLVRILRSDKFTGTQNQMEIIKEHLENDTPLATKNYQGSKGKKNSLRIGDETKTGLLEMVYDSGNDLEKFKARLEQWFNEVMDRAEGWYTKQTRLILFFIGLILALNFNIDCIAITKLLATNNTARTSMVEAASAFKMPDKPINDSDAGIIKRAKELLSNQIDSANKILGLGYADGKNVFGVMTEPNSSALPGWIITAFAISLGGPFWFDLLQRIMAIRQTGSKPAETSNSSISPKSQTASPNDNKNRVG